LFFVIKGASVAGYDQGYQQGGEYAQQSGYVEVTVEPSEVTIGPGEKATITCRVKGAENYKVTWGKYAQDTSLPNYARVCIKILFFNIHICIYLFK